MENKILEKLRKLLLHKESAEQIGSTSEAEAFALKIQDMLNQYNLSLSDINLEDRKSNMVREKGLDAKSQGFKGRSSYIVMNVIAQNNWCKAYASHSSSVGTMSVIGSKENVEVCKYLHSILFPLAVKLGKAEYLKFKKTDMSVQLGLITTSRGKYMRAYIDGFAKGLSVKFHREKEKFEVENPGVASLIVCNDQALKEFQEKVIGKTRTLKTKVSNVGDANSKGFSAGLNANIAKGISGSENNNTQIQ